jgi:MerR family copper efflux transcriptional regulator
MSKQLTIGKVARQTGLPTKTIRFYEEEGILPRPRRSQSGYRLYSETDVRLLGFVRRIRMLGVELPAIKALLERATSLNCGDFGDELNALLEGQRREIDQRIQELTTLRAELDSLQAHVSHCCEGCDPSEMALECSYCCLIDEEKGGE